MAIVRQHDTDFEVSEGETVAVLSDIHGNADALEIALRQLEETSRCDKLVILGDLFTYGVQPDSVVEQIVDVADDYEVWLVIGNHDEFYFESLGYADAATEGRPDWICEMIEWTRRRLVESNFEVLDDRKLWHRDLTYGPLLLSHANPFRGRDWTYLNDTSVRRRALQVLGDRKRTVGVFGHNHRRMACRRTSVDELSTIDDDQLFRNEIELSEGSWLLNPGSVGQPRETRPKSSFLMLRRETHRWFADFIKIAYDPGRHIEKIRQTELSESTRRRLAGYLVPDDDS